MLLRLFFGLSFIGLAVVLFGELDLNYVFSIFTADIIVSLLYVILNKSRITTSLAVNTNVRVIIAFLIMLVTMFFYAFALWRVDQFSAPVNHIIYRWCYRISCSVQLYQNNAYKTKINKISKVKRHILHT